MPALFTRTEWEALPEGFPAQLLGGQLLREPSPTYGHEDVRMRLLRRLMPLVAQGFLVSAPVDVLVDEHNVFQPDVAVLGHIPPWDSSYVGTPRAVFEVLSPGTAARDREVKTPAYLALGVEEVWLLDPTTSTIACHTKQATRVGAATQTVGSSVVPGLVLRPGDLFE